MRKYLIGGLLGALALIGAGCQTDSPVSLDKYSGAEPAQTQSEQMTVPSIDTPVEANSPDSGVTTVTSTGAATSTPETATSTSKNSSSSTTVTTPAPLAFPGVLPATETNVNIRIKTTKGDIVFTVLPKEGPNAASNFVYLTQHKFYDGLTFHRVEPGFVIQGGDPLGQGYGGPGYTFADDKVDLPVYAANPQYVTYAEGLVAMANAGPNTNGSQFFIMLGNNPLPPSYSVFGRVVSGMDVVRKIQKGDVMTTVTIEKKK